MAIVTTSSTLKPSLREITCSPFVLRSFAPMIEMLLGYMGFEHGNRQLLRH